MSFESLTDDEKDLLEKNSVTVDYKKGETISKQGSFASNIIYIESGLVKVYIEGKPKNLILTITPADHFVGLQAIIEGNNTFLYSVSTYIDSRVKLIDIQIFKQLLRQNPAFTAKIINILNENSAQAYGRFFCLTRKQLHGRLADILLCLSERIFKSEAFELPLSRNDLGELSGMSTESVIRIMKEFKDDKLIKVVCKTIEIVDKERIKKISEVG
ncbi:MAG: Crp/Fnr family transcriptional regulator [Bacteroidota bacterium]|nr:Crp/Fnr family transcriptional regulator [Bacteroidota bacterium]